jgi:ubiquitin-like protein Pup
MSGRLYKSRSPAHHPTEVIESDKVKAKRRSKQREAEEIQAELDDMLDEIDSVLMENAEEFVDNFVQKGGE